MASIVGVPPIFRWSWGTDPLSDPVHEASTTYYSRDEAMQARRDFEERFERKHGRRPTLTLIKSADGGWKWTRCT